MVLSAILLLLVKRTMVQLSILLPHILSQEQLILLVSVILRQKTLLDLDLFPHSLVSSCRESYVCQESTYLFNIVGTTAYARTRPYIGSGNIPPVGGGIEKVTFDYGDQVVFTKDDYGSITVLQIILPITLQMVWLQNLSARERKIITRFLLIRQLMLTLVELDLSLRLVIRGTTYSGTGRSSTVRQPRLCYSRDRTCSS